MIPRRNSQSLSQRAQRLDHSMSVASSCSDSSGSVPPPPPPPSLPPEYEEETAADGGVDKGSATSSLSLDIADLLAETDHDGIAILLRRPDRISVSYYSPPLQQRGDADKNIGSNDSSDSDVSLSGLKFRTTATGDIVIDGIQQQNKNTPFANLISRNVNSCSLLQGSCHSSTYFDVGDLVEYACGVDCRQGAGENFATEATVNSASAAIPDSLDESGNSDNIKVALNQTDRDHTINKFHTNIREYSSGAFVTTVCASTTKSWEDPIRLCQAIILLEDRGDLFTEPQDNHLGIKFFQLDNRLIIESISKRFNDGWFGSSGCAIKEGHIVVGINEFISSTFSPEDATSIIRSILSSPSSNQLSITTIAREQINGQLTRWDKIRKGAVAVGGGTLVTTGAVLMATPLHPVGHAMALGGVGVLGMEFEAPRKVMGSAKERWNETRRNWSERRLSRKESSNIISQQEDGSCREEQGGGMPDLE